MPISSRYQLRRRIVISSLLLLFSLLYIVAAPAQRAFAAPTISAIDDKTTAEDMATTPAIDFTVGDTTTAPGDLTVSGSSNNTALVPNANIVFGGSGANRTVTVTPALNQSGTATITVTVSDGEMSATETFLLTVNAVNDVPTVSAIANQNIPEDGATGALAFTVRDVETAAASLTVSASSDNTTLVPNSNIVLGGSGASRTVQVTPVANGFGTAVITISANDGTATGTSAFTLIVEEDNDIPTVSPIADQLINEDTSTTALAFTVADTETPATELVVRGTSENAALVPNENIVVSGTGANRTVKVTPVPNGYGTATIIISASDGAAEGSTNFVVSVANINDAPTMTAVADQTVNEDTPTAALPFTIADSDNPLSEVSVTGTSSNTLLIPNTNITFTGTGDSRNVTVTPAANLSGSTTITLTASDGGLSSTRTFVVNVIAVNDAPTISDIANRSTQPGTSTGAISFTISDIETAHGSLTVSGTSSNTALVPNANIVFGGSGASRTVTVTPVAGELGTTTITVTVSDGSLTGSDTFVLVVGTDATAPTVTVTFPANGAFIR